LKDYIDLRTTKNAAAPLAKLPRISIEAAENEKSGFGKKNFMLGVKGNTALP
jgi:hypothetical protein